MLRRIDKKEARRRFTNKGAIYLLPSKVGLGSAWVKPVEVSGFKENDFSVEAFDKQLNAFAYYNCNDELGKAIHYYANV